MKEILKGYGRFVHTFLCLNGGDAARRRSNDGIYMPEEGVKRECNEESIYYNGN